jgi:hypothetical protein
MRSPLLPCYGAAEAPNGLDLERHLHFVRELVANFPDQFALSILFIRAPPRGQFTSSAVVMLMRLTNRAHYVGEKSLTIRSGRFRSAKLAPGGEGD